MAYLRGEKKERGEVREKERRGVRGGGGRESQTASSAKVATTAREEVSAANPLENLRIGSL